MPIDNVWIKKLISNRSISEKERIKKTVTHYFLFLFFLFFYF